MPGSQVTERPVSPGVEGQASDRDHSQFIIWEAMLLGDLVTKREAAELLRVSHWTVNAWLSTGKLRRVKFGNRTLVSRANLESFLQERRV
jgi:excisionase family DNA binding protein